MELIVLILSDIGGMKTTQREKAPWVKGACSHYPGQRLLVTIWYCGMCYIG